MHTCHPNYIHFDCSVRIKREYFKKLPPNTKSVARPGKFGNPLRLIRDMIYINAGYRRKVLDKWVFLCHGDINKMLKIYEALLTQNWNNHDVFDVHQNIDIRHWSRKYKKLDFTELKGKNLACFCKEGDPCHADILLNYVKTL